MHGDEQYKISDFTTPQNGTNKAAAPKQMHRPVLSQPSFFSSGIFFKAQQMKAIAT
jgi:hypothetical protein